MNKKHYVDLFTDSPDNAFSKFCFITLKRVMKFMIPSLSF